MAPSQNSHYESKPRHNLSPALLAVALHQEYRTFPSAMLSIISFVNHPCHAALPLLLTFLGHSSQHEAGQAFQLLVILSFTVTTTSVESRESLIPVASPAFAGPRQVQPKPHRNVAHHVIAMRPLPLLPDVHY